MATSVAPQVQQSISRIPALDGWRGIAILLVLTCHLAGQPLHFVLHIDNAFTRFLFFGWCGVDLFFILSGFLLTRILLENIDSPTYYSTFYLRRAFRILPPYMLMVAILDPLTRIVGLPHTPWYTYLFTSDFTFVFRPWWPGWGHLWSLALEEQFYLVLPLLLRFKKDLIPTLSIFAIALTPFIRFMEMYFLGEIGTRFLPFGRVDTFFAGALIAWTLREKPELLQRLPLRWLTLSTACILAVFVVANPPITVLGNILGHSLVELFLSLVTIEVLLSPNRWTWLSDPRLRHIGRNSYTIYLLHLPIYILLADDAGLPFGLSVAVTIALSFGLSELSWRLLESRMIQIGQSFRYKSPRLPSFSFEDQSCLTSRCR